MSKSLLSSITISFPWSTPILLIASWRTFVKKGESMAQYHVHLWLQVAKCGFTDPDDIIRSKILQTISVTRNSTAKQWWNTLQQFLEHVANKYDISHQDQDMEENLLPAYERVDRIHLKRTQKPKHKHMLIKPNKLKQINSDSP